MSLEDPRIRMRQLQLQQSQDPSITNMAEHIPLQVSDARLCKPYIRIVV